MGQTFSSSEDGLFSSLPEEALSQILKTTVSSSLPESLSPEQQIALTETSQIQYIKKKPDPEQFLQPERVRTAIKQLDEAIALLEAKKMGFFSKVGFFFSMAQKSIQDKDFNGAMNFLVKRRETEKRGGEIILKLEILKNLRKDAEIFEKEISSENTQFRLAKEDLLNFAQELSEFDFVENFLWMKKISEEEADNATEEKYNSLQLRAAMARLNDNDKERILVVLEQLKKKLKTDEIAHNWLNKAKSFLNYTLKFSPGEQ